MKSIRFINEETGQQFKYSVPDEWRELNRKQLFFLIDLVDNGITPEEIKLKMLLFCIGGRVIRFRIDNSYTIRIGKNKFNLTAEELTVISEIFSYLFTETKETIHINPSSFVNLFPSIRIGWAKLYGPADGLTDMNYQRFAEILDCVSNMDKDFSNLDDFISYMYRKKKTECLHHLLSIFPAVKRFRYFGFTSVV